MKGENGSQFSSTPAMTSGTGGCVLSQRSIASSSARRTVLQLSPHLVETCESGIENASSAR
jgi:hypothetical protein